VDQRLVRQRYLHQCDHTALALYLVLVTVADAEGLSYYSDESLERMLRLDHATLSQARTQLCQRGLVAYQKPLYQVLALEEPPAVSLPAQRAGQALSVKDVLQHLFESGGQP
jgi:replication initiation and membrane attachment protein DnaB